MKKKLSIYIKGFLYLNILFCVLLSINKLPKNLILNNLIKNVRYYEGMEDRYYLVKNLPQSNHDVVTDCLVFNIISNIDSQNSLVSTVAAKYYVTDNTYSEDLKSTVLNEKGTNASYSRYFHGYMIVYRFLLLFMSINEIKIFMFLLATSLFLYFSYLCIKKRLKKVTVSMLISFFICMLPFSFNTIGHVFPYFIALLGCIVIICNKNRNTELLFLILGISVAFFDFLSVETLTLTLPLLCLIVKHQEENTALSLKTFTIININWLLGYIMTFLYKWLLNFLVLGIKYTEISISKGLDEIISSAKLGSGISLNINMLFPYVNSSAISLGIYLLLLSALAIFCYLFHKKDCNKYNTIGYLIFIFFIPYIRYFLLSNHGVFHYFFTYRAQISSLICIFLIIEYTMDPKLLKMIIFRKNQKKK